LRPCEGLSTRGISANDILELTLAAGKLAVSVRRRHVVTASQKIDTILAIVRCGHRRVTELDAECSGSDEVVPACYLGQGRVVLGSRQATRVDESTKRITSQISTVRVKLTSSVVGQKTNTSLSDMTSYLNIGAGLHELSTGDSASWHNTSAVTFLSAVSNNGSLNITDLTVRGG